MHRSQEAEACRQVWLAVLAQAVRDIFAPSAFNTRSDRRAEEKLLVQHKAEQWIGSRDFHRTCALAGLDGTKVEARLRRRMAERDAGGFDFAAVDPWKQAGRRALERLAA